MNSGGRPVGLNRDQSARHSSETAKRVRGRNMIEARVRKEILAQAFLAAAKKRATPKVPS